MDDDTGTGTAGDSGADNGGDGMRGALVHRSEFSATDADAAEYFLGRAYSDSKLAITATDREFVFSHTTTAAPGFASNRFTMGLDWAADVLIRPGDALTVIQPAQGRISYTATAYPDVHAVAGDVLLVPPESPAHIDSESGDVAAIQLDTAAVGAYADAMTGLDPDRLIFHSLTPSTPDLGRFWVATMTHVRDYLLTDPWTASQPTLLHQGFLSLTAALLSAMPNTAHDRISDPDRPPVRGDVPPAKLREVIDYLDAHADQPIGPVEIAGLADAPLIEVTEALRRHRGAHPAQLLWAARLRGVHRDLHDTEPGPDTDPDTNGLITPIATRWGFTHTGRFRTAYTRAFGERPEDTLRG